MRRLEIRFQVASTKDWGQSACDIEMCVPCPNQKICLGPIILRGQETLTDGVELPIFMILSQRYQIRTKMNPFHFFGDLTLSIGYVMP